MRKEEKKLLNEEYLVFFSYQYQKKTVRSLFASGIDIDIDIGHDRVCNKGKTFSKKNSFLKKKWLRKLTAISP
jgi:hypothetical protein